jgi:hypothetical protein
METKVDTRLGCGRPLLPPERFAPNPHRMYHDAGCRDLYRRNLASFTEQNPELPGWGRSPVSRPGADDRLRVVRASDGRLAVRFEKGPAKKAVREHHGTDTLPVSYYLADAASAEDGAAFLRESYQEA